MSRVVLERRPPRIVTWLLHRCLGTGGANASILGDLFEEFQLRREKRPRAAALWYWRVGLSLAVSATAWRLLRGFSSKPAASAGEQRWSRTSDAWLQDSRYACRIARRRPLFSLIAITSLAIGIGATAAIFSIVNTFLLRPLPGVAQHERLVELGRTSEGSGFDSFTYPDLVDLREGARSALDEVAALTFEFVSVEMGDGGERWNAMYTGGSYLPLMGVEPLLGRRFTEEEGAGAAGESVVILSHSTWENRFGSDLEIVGRSIPISRESMTVVGVLPKEFKGHFIGFDPDVWLPLGQHPEFRQAAFDGTPRAASRRASWLMAVGRLAEGVSIAEGQAAAETVFERLAREYPESNRDRGVQLVALGPVPGGAREGVQGFLAVLAGLVGLVLVATCSNVGGMLVANAAAREKEVAVRLAIGSSRWQLVRQLLVEAMLLFVIGGAVGATIAVVGLRSLNSSGFSAPVRVDLDLSPDLRVLLVALAVTLVTGITFGVMPALQASRPDLVAGLRGVGDGFRKGRLRRLLVTAQIAASMVLLITAGLFLRSLQKIGEVETGFDGRGVVTTTVDLSLEGYDSQERGTAFYDQVLDRVAALPGVEATAFSLDLPLDMTSRGTAVFPEGWQTADSGLGVSLNHVTADYLETLGIELEAGRAFRDSDVRGSERVAMVTAEFVRTAWPGEPAIGKTLRFEGEDDLPPYRIVGVTTNVINTSITEPPQPFVYLPLMQAYSPQATLSVRGEAGHLIDATALERAVLSIDPSVSLTPVTPLERVTGMATLPQKIAASVTSILGLIAILLSAVGIYGIVALMVARRTREIGIRMALGARRDGVLAHVMMDAVRLAVPGVIVGAVVGIAVAQLARSFLILVAPSDPLTMVSVALAISGVVMMASLIPARRASAVDPANVLRSE